MSGTGHARNFVRTAATLPEAHARTLRAGSQEWSDSAPRNMDHLGTRNQPRDPGPLPRPPQQGARWDADGPGERRQGCADGGKCGPACWTLLGTCRLFPAPRAAGAAPQSRGTAPLPPAGVRRLALTLVRRRRRWLVNPRMISESRQSAPISSRLGTLRGAPRGGSGGPGSAMEERSAGSAARGAAPSSSRRRSCRLLPARALTGRAPAAAAHRTGPPAGSSVLGGPRPSPLRSLRAARPRAPAPPARADSAPFARAAS